MNTFKRKALTCAVLAGLGGVATTAEAVYRNPDGTGMVLIYPYYTVNAVNGSNFNTYISVTNTTSQAKVTKVRFREGRTSAEVLDFNLYLSPNDVWVGAVMTGLLWRAALAGFSYYVRDLSRFSVHGSIAAVVVFLIWVYISAVILLYGVEVTAAYARLRRHRPDEVPAAPTPRV